MVAVHPLTDASMGVSFGTMSYDFRGRIRPHDQQVLRGAGPGDSGLHVPIGSMSHSPVM